MSDENQLEVVVQQEIAFYGDNLIAVQTSDGNVYAALSQMCDALGIDAQAQRRRIERHAVLSDGLHGVAIMTTPSQDGRGGGLQRAYALRADLVPLWLSGIQASRVSDEVRVKLIRFQREAGRVLWEAFQRGELSADTGFDELLVQADQDAVEAYQMLQSMIKLARSHVVLSARVDGHDQRLSLVEAQLGDKKRHVTVDQASRIQSAVSAIAFELGKRSNRNEFSGVWKEVYRRMDVPDYRSIPTARFEEVMNFLRQWWETITDSSNIPF